MKLSHWSVKYRAFQRLDPITKVKRNLRPLQIEALLAAAHERSTHENRHGVYTQGE